MGATAWVELAGDAVPDELLQATSDPAKASVAAPITSVFDHLREVRSSGVRVDRVFVMGRSFNSDSAGAAGCCGW
jgi:hypothetical protein